MKYKDFCTDSLRNYWSEAGPSEPGVSSDLGRYLNPRIFRPSYGPAEVTVFPYLSIAIFVVFQVHWHDK